MVYLKNGLFELSGYLAMQQKNDTLGIVEWILFEPVGGGAWHEFDAAETFAEAQEKIITRKVRF